MGIIMQENSFYIPCCSYSKKSKHLIKSPYFLKYTSILR